MPNNIIGRALAGLPLAPIERAALRLLEGLGATALIAAAPIVAQALADPAHINFSGTITAAIGAASTAVLLAVLKYVSAKGDSASPAALPGVAGAQAGPVAAVSPAGPTVPGIPANAQAVRS